MTTARSSTSTSPSATATATPNASKSIPTSSSPDQNRIIAVVTGANSGYGLGTCHQLLANLSLPSGSPIPGSPPLESATPSTLHHLLSPTLTSTSTATVAATTLPIPTQPQPEQSNVLLSPHPTLTLILACRSAKNAEEARTTILQQHEADLAKRRKKGGESAVPVGWREGLKVEIELIDYDDLGGERGVFAFTQRLKERLFLNAGFAGMTAIAYWVFAKQILTKGFINSVSHPEYNVEAVGLKSADGERGKVWGINVLAPYILAKELHPLLVASPPSLPFSPRIIYTSSYEAEASSLQSSPIDDYQLLSNSKSYRASKYMGDLVMCQLDREFGDEGLERPVRCLIADPGIVTTRIAMGSLGSVIWWANIKFRFYWLALFIAHILGSTIHPLWPEYGAIPMIYAALVANTYISPPSKVPAPVMRVHAHRFKVATVDCNEVDQWEKMDEVGKGIVERCESVRMDWRKRKGMASR